MSSLLDSQKTQSLIGLANLAQTQQVNQNVKALQASQQEGNRLRSEQIHKLQKNIEKEEAKFKSLKENYPFIEKIITNR